MNPRYFLVVDATAEEVERKTGLIGHNTHLGALVERPKSLAGLGRQLFELNAALNPQPPRCCYGTFMHAPNCPTWGVTS